MKAIISHDVDHITVWEHYNDLILPKFIVRNFIELVLGFISIREMWSRMKGMAENKWQNIEELMVFDRVNGVPSTFFIAVNQGKYLNYSLEQGTFWIERILKEGFEVGLHGITCDKPTMIRKEHDIFKKVSKAQHDGVRIHYLMNDEDNLQLLKDAGYAYDSSRYAMENPYRIGNLWEFPVHIMDGYILCQGRGWQNQNLRQAQETTKKIIGDAISREINYLNIIFHDRYFNDAFKTWKDWYMWIIQYLRESNIGLVTYNQAIEEMR